MICIFLYSGDVSAQACGGGFYSFNVYTLNGSIKKPFYYEFIPATKKFLNTYVGDVDKRRGVSIIPNTHAQSVHLKDTVDVKFAQLIKDRKISRKGRLVPGMRVFTMELTDQPVLMKVSDGNYSYYLLGNFFGGCDQILNIVWKDEKGIEIGTFE